MNTLTVIPTFFCEINEKAHGLGKGAYGFRVEVGDLQGYYTFGNVRAFRRKVADSLEDPSSIYAFLELQFSKILAAFLESADTDLRIELKGIASFRVDMDDSGYFLVPFVA